MTALAFDPSTGAVTQIGTELELGVGPSGSADGAYLIAVGEAQQRVGVFALDAAGTPTQVPNSPFSYTPTTASSSGLAITF